MAINLPLQLSPLQPIPGIRIGTASAQIKPTRRDDDLTLVELAPTSNCAAVFTRNAFCAAPVILAQRHLQITSPRFWLINAGNANAGTGERGLQDALASCQMVAQLRECLANEVLPFSTGVIGVPLPVDKIQAALPLALANLAANHWNQAATAIMTTDTVPKGISIQRSLAGKTVNITAIAKGAGMIKPDMATMLAFMATDAAVPQAVLQTCLNQAVEVSFNRITVDGDTSTNDACALVATGQGTSTIDSVEHPDFQPFCQAITEVCLYLAQAIIRDGEGATKFITITVEQGASKQECLEVAYAIAHSPLVKTAFFASDANWGRILAAVGRAGLADLNIDAVQIDLNQITIVRQGNLAQDYTEAQGQQVMAQPEIQIRVLLGRGHVQETIFTCDLSHDYVRINAEYRT
jgi:glutamate N-acetyltransferase/amino-acid N-acetyltransferase